MVMTFNVSIRCETFITDCVTQQSSSMFTQNICLPMGQAHEYTEIYSGQTRRDGLYDAG
jgi:hypothetical protein